MSHLLRRLMSDYSRVHAALRVTALHSNAGVTRGSHRLWQDQTSPPSPIIASLGGVGIRAMNCRRAWAAGELRAGSAKLPEPREDAKPAGAETGPSNRDRPKQPRPAQATETGPSNRDR